MRGKTQAQLNMHMLGVALTCIAIELAIFGVLLLVASALGHGW